MSTDASVFLEYGRKSSAQCCTVLDPHIKKIAFTDMAPADQCTRHLTQEMVGKIATNYITMEVPNATETASTETEHTAVVCLASSRHDIETNN